MERVQKQRIVEELSTVFKESAGVLLMDFTGVNVADETELRRKMTDSGGSYRVVKNTLARLAARESAVAQLEPHFQGPTAVAFTRDNPVALAKTLTEFIKAHPGTSLKAGLLEESALTVDEVQALADLPSREELLAKLVYLLQAPLMNLAAALQGPLRSLASGLSRLEEVKQKQD